MRMKVEWRERLRSPTLVSVALGILACLLVVGLRSAGYLQFLELASYDALLRVKERHTVHEPRLVVVQIVEEDIQRIRQWPPSDDRLADLLEALLGYSPRVIGVDLYRDFAVPPGTERFTNLIKNNESIIFVEKFLGATGDRVLGPEVLRGTERIGFSDVTVDSDGVVRRGLLFLDNGQDFSISLPLRLAMAYLADDGITLQAGETNPEHLRLGKTTFVPFEANDGAYVDADAAGYQYLLDYRGGVNPFTTYSMSDVLDGNVDPELIRDSIVIAGVNSVSVKDEFLTPYDRFAGAGQATAGAAVHAYETAQLLRAALAGDQPTQVVNDRIENLWILLWGTLAATLGSFARSGLRFTLLAIGGLAVMFTVAFVAFMQGWWIPVAPTGLVWLAASGVVTAYLSTHEKTEKRLLMELFSKNVSPAVADELWRHRDSFMHGGRLEAQTMTITVLFSDLANFTPVAERLTPTELLNWLNEYMETMASLVTQYGGVVDNYIGDAIKADFGVPIPRTTEDEIRQDATNAVSCALAMRREMERLNDYWSAQGSPLVRIRVGIATGPVVAGCLGSTQRIKYTTIGDVVNTSARLESFSKEAPGNNPDSLCQVLLAEQTAECLEDRFELEPVGTVSLKGKSKGVMVYRLLGEKAAVDVEASPATSTATATVNG
jgi:adenylate cyclase